MAPPSHARMNAEGKGYASRWESPIAPKKVTKRVQESKKPKMERFPEFPTEIQQMIWRDALKKPACHTFRFLQTKTSEKTTMHVTATQSSRDTSSWRYWKSLLYCRVYKQPMDEPDETPMKKKTGKVGAQKSKAKKSKAENPKAKKSRPEKPTLEGRDLERFKQEKKNLQPPSESDSEDDPPKSDVQKSHEAFSKLANFSFQAGFRRSMLRLVKINTSEPDKPDKRGKRAKKEDALIDAETDLVILEFNRGENAGPNSWFEHTGLGELAIHDIRMQTRDLKRVAVYYKRAHANANKRGPFQCWCANPATLACNTHKACPLEQACFLDCFANLEEFYHVVEITGKKAEAWLHNYRRDVRLSDYNLKTWLVKEKKWGPVISLAHFYDQKYEYIQLPRIVPVSRYTGQQWIDEFPLDAHQESRDCLQTVSNIYKGKTGKDDYNTPLQQRRKVKFGVLFAFRRDDIEHDDETKD